MASYKFMLGVFRAADAARGSRYSVRMYRPGADFRGLTLVHRARNWHEANREAEHRNLMSALERG